MELRHLRYFAAVAETLNFRRAAERLRVAQPALSKQIRDLEHACGTRLFDRNTKRVRLTDAGTALLDEARALLTRAEALPQLARDAAQGRRGRLTLGNSAALTGGFLPAALAAFQARFPEVEVNLVEIRLRQQQQALRSGGIQIGIVAELSDGEGDEFECLRVVRSPFVAVMARRHPLARSRRVSLHDLASQRLLAVAPDQDGRGHAAVLRELFQNRGLRPPYFRTVDSSSSLMAMVAGIQGVSILPGVYEDRLAGELVTKPIDMAGENTFTLWAVWQKKDPSQLVRNFVEVLRKRTVRRNAG